jgi:hypothetical protein
MCVNVSSSILWDNLYAHLWLHVVTIYCRIQLRLQERRDNNKTSSGLVYTTQR